MTGRNDPCPCGSGEKYKRCCGLLSADTSQSSLSENATGPREYSAAVRQGLRYLATNSVSLDTAGGVAIIEQAAQAGDTEAAFLAATLASTSLWRAQNWDEAFNYLLQAAQQGHQPAQSSLRILAGGPAGRQIEGDNWADMRGKIDLEAWITPPAMQVIHEAPRVQVLENFMPPAACDWLIERAATRLFPATIYGQVTGGTTEDERRTNSQCDLDVEASGVLTFILRARIGAITGRPELAMEIPKVLHYQPGETFEEHCDYLDPKVPAYRQELAQRGQRAHTFLVYLNDDFTGGETLFTKLDFSHKGATGGALLFANVNNEGEPDADTEHVGMPPTSGEKWLFSQWIRDLPRG